MFDLKKKLMWSKLKVGLILTLTLLTLFFTVFFAGKIEHFFSPRVDITAEIEDVKGLRKGAPVWLSGIEIGSVKDIRLYKNYGALVTLAIRKSELGFIKKGAHASILTMGLLGDKYVELSRGDPEAQPIKPGEKIEGAAQVDLKDMMTTSVHSIERLDDLIKRFDRLVGMVEKGEGTVAKLLNDPSLYNNLSEASRSLSIMLGEMKEARGTMSHLIKDTTLYDRMLSAASAVEDFGKRLNEGRGTLQNLMRDPSLYERLEKAASSMEEFAKKLNEGSGTLRMLAEDPSVYNNLSTASRRLSAILERIEEGEGVAGTLVSDRELAAELKDIVAEIRDLAKDIRENPKRYFSFSIF
jgi:phospholipid/cholesterol/gamma-HCH transport system substrate-binding protein